MPRFIIERVFGDVDDEAMGALGVRSKRIITEQLPEITWEHSHVVVDAEGNTKTYCVYEAPDEQVIRRHAELLGAHRIDAIYQIGADVHPEEIPLG